MSAAPIDPALRAITLSKSSVLNADFKRTSGSSNPA